MKIASFQDFAIFGHRNDCLIKCEKSGFLVVQVVGNAFLKVVHSPTLPLKNMDGKNRHLFKSAT
jgi:hypothetical protein